MTPIVFHFDPISPYACLAFHELPRTLEGISHVVEYRPVLFAGLLKALAHKGPVEVPGKREWTYRQVDWLAARQGISDWQRPQPHPFNPLPLLRLALACGPAGRLPGRRVVERLFDHVWRAEGADPIRPDRLAALRAELAPMRDPDADEVKGELRALTEDALQRGVFGVPTFEARGQLYWGLDALPMLREDLLRSA